MKDLTQGSVPQLLFMFAAPYTNGTYGCTMDYTIACMSGLIFLYANVYLYRHKERFGLILK